LTSRVSLSHDSLSETVKEQVTHPELWRLLKKRYANVRVSHYTYGQLARIEGETGLRTLGQVVDFLVEGRRENILPASFDLVFCDDRPVSIAGVSGSGKSLFLISMVIPRVEGPLFVIDVANEYRTLKRLGLGDFFQVHWAKTNLKLRFVPDKNPDVAKVELQNIFSRLSAVKVEHHDDKKFPSGNLSRWVILVEEAHRLSNEPVFQHFVAEARKFTRKLIVVCSDPTLFGNVCRLLKPPPLEELKRQAQSQDLPAPLVKQV